MAESGRGRRTRGVAGGRTGPNEAARGAGASSKTRRRWKRWLLIVAVLLAVVIAFAPALLSTGLATRMVLGVVNDRVRGTVRIEDLSLSWWGPCRAVGLQVLDPDGREVLRVSEIRLAAGLWGLLTGSGRFESLRVVAPRATLYLAEDGTISLVQAFEPVEPGPKPPPKPLPKLRGGVAVTDGAVRIVRPDGREYEVPQINGELAIDTLDRLRGNINFQVTGGGRAALAWNLSGLIPAGQFKLEGADGTFEVSMAEPLDLAPLAEFAGAGAKLRGTARVDLNGGFESGKLAAEFKLETQRLYSGDLQRSGVQPIDLVLSGRLGAAGEEISGTVNLTGDAGGLHADFAYRPSAKPSPLSLDRLLAAAFGGEPISLPDLSLDANGAIDLPRLAKAIPSLLKVLPGVEITNGRVVVDGVSIRGGSEPSLAGRVALEYLAARKGGVDISYAPVSVSLTAALDKEAGLKIDDIDIRSAFASATGKGTIADLKTRFDADLARLHKELGSVFDLADLPRKGTLAGSLNLARQSDGRVGVVLDVNVADYEYKRDERAVQIRTGRIHQDGYIVLRERRPVEAVLTSGSIELDEDLSVTGSGGYDVQKRTFRFDVAVTRADLAGLARRSEGLGAGEV
ncbi:MAG TPA: hypothetical protein VMZ50_06150, partial [Phycisphaerae bacterium]|nr:hypothetical protein [Phycisphaerae bacterium]